MKKTRIKEGRRCPKCGRDENQMNHGFNRSGTQRCKRKNCNHTYTMQAVVEVFVDAYNKFGEAKLMRRVPVTHKSQNHAKHLHKFREVGFSLIDFL